MLFRKVCFQFFFDYSTLKLSKMIRSTIVFIFLFYSFHSNAQMTKLPNQGMKSHLTLQITKIERTSIQTILELTVQNQTLNGWFCADKNIIITNAQGGETYKILRATGIPICPDQHQFKKLDETLSFVLYFPAIDPAIKYINLIENCEDACFSFKGVILDEKFNREIDRAFELYKQKKNTESVDVFIKLIETYASYPYGLLYFSIIKIYHETGQSDLKKKWIELLKMSTLEDKEFYLDLLKQKNMM